MYENLEMDRNLNNADNPTTTGVVILYLINHEHDVLLESRNENVLKHG